MRRLRFILGGIAAAAIAGAGAWYGVDALTARARPSLIVLGMEDLKDVPVLQPSGDPGGIVILISDKDGIGKRERAMTSRLLDQDMIVLQVDLRVWRAALDARSGNCLYLASALENIAKEALRRIDLQRYFHPVLAGIGEGGTLAYAALTDAPTATLAGAVALDPAASLQTKLPTCPGAATITRADSGFAYALDASLPAPAALIVAEMPASPSGEVVSEGEARPAGAGQPEKADILTGSEPADRLDQAVDATVTMAEADADTAALPVIDMPAVGPTKAVAVFLSGDGGWRDLDKNIGDWLATQGIHVIGVDSLRYFWTERRPEQIATDTQTILDQADPGGALPVAILGYSFGADTFPFAWKHLPQALRDRVKLVALLGTEDTTRFQVSVGGWLGVGGDERVAPAIATIPPEKVFCVHGEDEDQTACTDPLLLTVETLKLDGGHHFDGDYDALAARLLAAFEKRAAPPA